MTPTISPAYHLTKDRSTIRHTRTLWYSYPDQVGSAQHQMAIDASLLELCEERPNLAFVRFYRMEPSAVTIGCHQRWRSVVDPTECARRAWDWARRPTGGGALLHSAELNYAVVIGADHVHGRDFFDMFHWIMDSIAHGLRAMGVSLDAQKSDDGNSRTTNQHGLCGRSLTRLELAHNGLKLVAAAQRLGQHAILQHGTMYVSAPKQIDRFWPESLEVSGAYMLQRWSSISSATHPTNWKTVASVLRRGFVDRFGHDLHEWVIDQQLHHRIRDRDADWERSRWRTRR